MFCELIQFEQFSGGDCDGAKTIMDLVETGRAGRFAHLIECHDKQWAILCALEDALIDTHNQEGWMFVVGRLAEDEEVEGWLEYDGWVIMPYGPKRATELGSDVALTTVEDFYEQELEDWARTPVADDSGIILNKVLKEKFYINKSLGT